MLLVRSGIAWVRPIDILLARNLGFAQSDPARMETVLYVTAEAIRRLAIAAQAFTPIGAAKFLDALNIDADKRQFANISDADKLQPGAELPAPTPVFKRFEHEAKD